MVEAVCGAQSEEEGDNWEQWSTQTYCSLGDNAVGTGTSSGFVHKLAL